MTVRNNCTVACLAVVSSLMLWWVRINDDDDDDDDEGTVAVTDTGRATATSDVDDII